MVALDVKLEGDNCWPELHGKGFVCGHLVGVARLPKGTSVGKSTVVFRVDLPDGRTVLAETTLTLLRTAMVAIEAREQMEASDGPHN